MKLWHPIMEEIDIPRGALDARVKYSEIETEAKVESLVPLKFNHGLAVQRQQSNPPYRGGSRGGRGERGERGGRGGRGGPSRGY